MKIFVTGGTGFIGKYLIEELLKTDASLYVLSRNYANNCITNDKINFIQGNLSDTEKIKNLMLDIKPDKLIHLAWDGLPDYSIQNSIRNLKLGMNLFLEAANAGCSHIISTGSCWEYESRFGSISEESNIGSLGAFPAAKNSLNIMGKAIASTKGIKFNWLRLFYVYGAGQRETSLIPHVVQCVIDNKIPNIKTINNKNDFIYIKDLVKAVVKLAFNDNKYTDYNIGSGTSYSVKDVIEIVYTTMGREVDESKLQNSSLKCEQDFWSDISRIKSEVEWSPQYDLAKGISETVEYILRR